MNSPARPSAPATAPMAPTISATRNTRSAVTLPRPFERPVLRVAIVPSLPAMPRPSTIARGGAADYRRPPMNMRGPLAAFVIAVLAAGSGCLRQDFTKDDPQPATNGPTQQVLDQLAASRASRHLPPPSVIPELRPPALRGMVAVSRGDQALATAAHDAALRVVQIMGRHTWTFATACTDLPKLQLRAVK